MEVQTKSNDTCSNEASLASAYAHEKVSEVSVCGTSSTQENEKRVKVECVDSKATAQDVDGVEKCQLTKFL